MEQTVVKFPSWFLNRPLPSWPSTAQEWMMAFDLAPPIDPWLLGVLAEKCVLTCSNLGTFKSNLTSTSSFFTSGRTIAAPPKSLLCHVQRPKTLQWGKSCKKCWVLECSWVFGSGFSFKINPKRFQTTQCSLSHLDFLLSNAGVTSSTCEIWPSLCATHVAQDHGEWSPHVGPQHHHFPKKIV